MRFVASHSPIKMSRIARSSWNTECQGDQDVSFTSAWLKHPLPNGSLNLLVQSTTRIVAVHLIESIHPFVFMCRPTFEWTAVWFAVRGDDAQAGV